MQQQPPSSTLISQILRPFGLILLIGIFVFVYIPLAFYLDVVCYTNLTSVKF